MNINQAIRSGGAGVVVLLSLSAPAWGERRPAPAHLEEYRLDSGKHDGRGDAEGPPWPEELWASTETVSVPGAPWIRLHLSAAELGRGSYVVITSAADGGQQRLDAQALETWRDSTAVFNGDAVDVDLFVAPGDEGVFYEVDAVMVGEWADGGDAAGAGAGGGEGDEPETLCGADNRVASTDPRVGRIFGIGCTAWITSNGAMLTAGHCVDFSAALDANGCCTQCPNGVVEQAFLNDIVEFNVPASLPNGTLVAANPNNQYPIVAGSVVHNFDGQCQGLGKDWAIFACGPNANTGLLPAQAQGQFFRMTREVPAVNATIRITGFGVDMTPVGTTGGANAQTQTNQTSTGAFNGETPNGADFTHNYAVDTTGGNSGSPIIWESTGFTIGIHTNGGCAAGGNNGTSFEHDPLEVALQAFPGANTVYIDTVSQAPAENGTVFAPFNTIAEGVTAVAAGGNLSVVAGTYSGVMTVTKAMTLRAPVGAVTIGQ